MAKKQKANARSAIMLYMILSRKGVVHVDRRRESRRKAGRVRPEEE